MPKLLIVDDEIDIREFAKSFFKKRNIDVFTASGGQEALEIIPSEKTIVTTSGIPIPDDGDNIILKAYELLGADFQLPPVKIHLHKAKIGRAHV